jgi:hypothetical protein
MSDPEPPVPYTLTAKAEAYLDAASDHLDAVSGSPDATQADIDEAQYAYGEAHAVYENAAEAAAEAAGPAPSYVAYWDQAMAWAREAAPERYAEADMADWEAELGEPGPEAEPEAGI